MVRSIALHGLIIQLIPPLVGIASQEMDSLLSLDGGEAGSDQKKKKSLPPHITTPRKGPLLLQKAQQQTASSRSQQQTEVASYLKEKRRHYGNHPQAKLLKSGVRMCAPVRRGLLTRYPVMALTPKPMDAIEDHLMKGEMTWSQLKYNVQLMMVSACVFVQKL